MNIRAELEDLVRSALRLSGPTSIDHLVGLVPSASWSQIFLAVDRLSRSGLVTLRRTPHGEYRVALNGLAA
jgi:hypothetical protein